VDTIIITVAIGCGYLFYWKLLGRIKLRCLPDKEVYSKQDNLSIAPTAPQQSAGTDYPIGWYPLLEAAQLKAGTAQYIHYLGEHFAVFRDKSGAIYAVDAFCPHMGANLGLSGHVFDHSITCGFHGWTYDGKTGQCTNHPKAKSGCFKAVLGMCKYEVDNMPKEVKVKTWELREVNRMILVWFHPHNAQPLWEPYAVPEIDNGQAHFRGDSVIYVRTNLRDIHENGADTMHFAFIHRFLFNFTHWIKLKWDLTPTVYTGKEELLAKLTGNLEHYRSICDLATRNVPLNYTYLLFLTLYFEIGKHKFRVLETTATQIGPGQVCLNMRSIWLPKFSATILFYVVPIHGRMQKFIQRIYTPWYVPYWLSAFILNMEFSQVVNDAKIWNFKGMPNNQLISEGADSYLTEWRQWFAKFYV
jgi:cholesterol 7-dehydrogenase